MPLPRLEIVPEQTGYTVQEPNDSVRVETNGGRAAVYADMIGASSLVSLTWLLDQAEYEALVAFYLANRGKPFLLDLVIDEPFPSEYEVNIIPDTFSLSGLKGLAYTVTAQVEALGKPADEDYDNLVILMYEANDPENFGKFISLLDKLVNIVMPEFIHA